jgi:hypothetical protein
MTKVNSSPERHTFQKEGAIKRAEEKGEEPNQAYIDMWEQIKIDDANKINDPEWQKDNMEYDLRSTEWILEKVRGDDVYAQNLYAAMCNNEFTKNDVWPILTEKRWSRSWRSAGGIIADMQEKGDYVDWYCSGIKNNENLDDEQFRELTKEQQEFYLKMKAYVSESDVTDEIREDLLKLGWIVIDEDEDSEL